MNFKIEGIQVSNFRGIRDLYLELQEQNLLIIGENGTGKSSIIDAFEFALKGKVDKLKQGGDVTEKKSIPFVNAEGGARVSLEVVYPENKAERIDISFPYDPGVIPDGLKEFVAQAQEHNFVLRRSRILQFIDAKGGERYGEFSKLIGLEQLENMVTAWSDKRNSLLREVKQVEQNYLQHLTLAGQDLGGDISSESELVDSINTYLGRFGQPGVTNLGDLEEQLNDIHLQLDSVDSASPKLHKLNHLRDVAQELPQFFTDVATSVQKVTAAEQEYTVEKAVLDEAALEVLLLEGRRVFHDQIERKTCPLCERSIPDLPAFISRLDTRITELQALTIKRTALNTAFTTAIAALVSLGDKLEEFHSLLNEAVPQFKQTGVLAAKKQVSEWQQTMNARRVPVTGPDFIEHSALGQLLGQIPSIEAEVELEINSLKAEPQLELLLNLTSTARDWRAAVQQQEKLKTTRELAQRYERLYNKLVEARRAGIQAIQEEIADSLERLYHTLHPDDARLTVSFRIHNKNRSINLLTSFLDQNDDPRNYYSEGHLDSLGLCIFLAFILRFNQDFKLIILDDVLTTIDSGHRLRVARLLAQEFKDYQLILTTHDRLWAEQLRHALAAGSTRFVRLKPWTWETGTDSQEYIPRWSYYREQAAGGYPQEAIAGTGRTFEKFLYEMRGRLRLHMHAQPDDQYTIGDMYGPFFSWLRKSRPVRSDWPAFSSEIERLEGRLDQVWRLRNWSGSHHNPWGEAVSETDAMSFIDEIEKLVGAFECPVCRTLVVYNSYAKVLHCPECRPCPPPQPMWEYNTDWAKPVLRKLQLTHEAAREGAVIETRKAFERFLQDARRLYPLAVQAQPDDLYSIGNLFEAFVKWTDGQTLAFPDNRSVELQDAVGCLSSYLVDGQWQTVPEGDRAAFVQTVVVVTHLFHCPENDCGRLLTHREGQFYCPVETETSYRLKPQPALWYINQA